MLFRGDAEKRFVALAFLARLSHGRVDWLLRHVKIAFAAAVPVDLINLRVIFHSTHNVTKMVFVQVTEVYVLAGPSILFSNRFEINLRVQYSGGCPSGRVFHRRCTHNHWSGYFRT